MDIGNAWQIILLVAMFLVGIGLFSESPIGSIGGLLVFVVSLHVVDCYTAKIKELEATTFTRQQIVDRGLAEWVATPSNGVVKLEWKKGAIVK